MHEQHKCCSTESSTTEEKFLIETVMEQGKLAIPEKNEFENWNKSKIKRVFFGSFGPYRVCSTDQNKKFSNRRIRETIEAFS